MTQQHTYDPAEMARLNRTFRAQCEAVVNGRRDALHLPEGPLTFVYGVGTARSGVMLIGEAPGKDEVRRGEPFVGKAGGILRELLGNTGFVREDLYITNVMKYRLARAGKRPGTLANRPATAFEIANSTPWLVEEILLVRPKLIVTLGNVPLRAVRGASAGDGGAYCDEKVPACEIGQCHGAVLECRLRNWTAQHIPLYHPASLIYNRALRAAYEADLEQVRRCVARPSGGGTDAARTREGEG